MIRAIGPHELHAFWASQIEKAIKVKNDDKDKEKDKDKGTGLAQWWQVLNYPVWEYSTDPLDWFTEYDDRLKSHLLLVTSWKVSQLTSW